MVNYRSSSLDRTFAALANPTRRAILARLERQDEMTVSGLAKPFELKLHTVMKHLDVLDSAGLVSRVKVGRTVTVRLKPRPMRAAAAWLARYERFWAARLDRLATYAAAREAAPRERER